MPRSISSAWLYILAISMVITACGVRDDASDENYIGLSKEQLWRRLSLESGDTKTSIIAFHYPNNSGLRSNSIVMINRANAEHLPETFGLAKIWRWDSKDRVFHEFTFSTNALVIDIKRDVAWRK